MLYIESEKINEGYFKLVYFHPNNNNYIVKINKKKNFFPLFKSKTHILKIPNYFFNDFTKRKIIFKKIIIQNIFQNI